VRWGYVALHLYRRHRRECKGNHEEDSVSSEFDERRKGWKRRECPITASGKDFLRWADTMSEWMEYAETGD
jgi:hypothetical protein